MSAWQIAKGMLLKDLVDFAIAVGVVVFIGVCAWVSAKRKGKI
jgi:hypothetical protein